MANKKLIKNFKKINTGLIFKIIMWVATHITVDMKHLKRMFNSDFLCKDEKEILKKYIQTAEELNTNKITNNILALKDDGFIDYFKDFESGNNKEIIIHQNDETLTFPSEICNDFATLVNLFLVEREKEQLERKSLEELKKNGITDTLKLLVNKSVKIPMNITCADITDFKKMYQDTKNRFTIPTFPYLDKLTNGLEQGYVNTLITNEIGSTKTFSVYVGYQALIENRNVLHISNYSNSEDILACYLIKHFQTIYPQKIEEITLENIKYHNIPEDNSFWIAYEDFTNKYKDHLQILSLQEVNITSTERLYDILSSLQTTFVQNTGQGTDFLLVEGVENLILEKKYLKTSNVATVLENYMPFFKEQAKHFLNTNNPIALLLTSNSEKMQYAQRDNCFGGISNGYISATNIDKSIVQHSDNIILLYNNYSYNHIDKCHIFDFFVKKCKDKLPAHASIEVFVDFDRNILKCSDYSPYNI